MNICSAKVIHVLLAAIFITTLIITWISFGRIIPSNGTSTNKIYKDTMRIRVKKPLRGTKDRHGVHRKQQTMPQGINLNERVSYLLPDYDEVGKATKNKTQKPARQEITKTLILSYVKSGSVFLGELLSKLPFTFYHSEPLYTITAKPRRISGVNSTLWARKLINKLMDCDYKNLTKYFKLVKAGRQLAPVVSKVCPKNKTTLCARKHVYSGICSLCPHQLMMDNRLKVREARQLLKSSPELRIIHMVRDPRGIYNSRKHAKWCNGSCIDPEVFCGEMRKDTHEAKSLRKEFPKRFLSVRYEDLASDLLNRTNSLLGFLGFSMNAEVRSYIKSHTKAKKRSNGRVVYVITNALRWKKNLKHRELKNIEDTCSKVMRIWKYK